MVAGDHDEVDAGLPQAGDRGRRGGARRIAEGDEAAEVQAIDAGVVEVALLAGGPLGDRQHAQALAGEVLGAREHGGALFLEAGRSGAA